MTQKRSLFLYTLIIIFYAYNSFATTYNNIAINTTSYVTTDNTIQSAARGFVYFTNGIIFDGTVNVALPVAISGNLQFGNGETSKIILESDLTVGSTAGTAVNAVTITTSSNYAEIVGNGGKITCNGDTFFSPFRSIRVLGDLTIDGRGHDLIFGNLTTFTIVSGATLTICNARLRRLSMLNFVGPGTLTLENTSVILDYDWTYSGNASFGTPALTFKGNTVFEGINKKFIYAGGQNMSLAADAMVAFDIGTTFSWASHRRNGLIMGLPQTAALMGSGSLLFFNNSNLAAPSRGIDSGLYIQIPTYQFNLGSLAFNNYCKIYNDGNTDINKSLKYDDTTVYVLNGAQVEIDGYVYDAKKTIAEEAQVIFDKSTPLYNVFTFNDAWYGSSSNFAATFFIASNDNAVIVFSDEKDKTSGTGTLLVTIGAYDNAKIQVIHEGREAVITPIEEMSILDGINVYTQFWIQFYSSPVGFFIGKGHVIGENILAYWNASGYSLPASMYLGFGGWIPCGPPVYYKNITIVS
jgi:hypothetical protein